jgi:FlaA1/EpsC-like NDP-sugar epimerase
MAVRFLNLLAASVFSNKVYAPAALTIFTFTLALVAKFQPYKCKKNNTADIVMLLAVIIIYMSLSMYLTVDHWLFSKLLKSIISGTAALTVYCCLLFLILSKHNIFLKVAQYFKKSKQQLFLIFSKLNFGKIKHGEINTEDQALLNHNEADYNSFDNH